MSLRRRVGCGAQKYDDRSMRKPRVIRRLPAQNPSNASNRSRFSMMNPENALWPSVGSASPVLKSSDPAESAEAAAFTDKPRLPPEMWINIMSFLPIEDVFFLRYVCSDMSGPALHVFSKQLHQQLLRPFGRTIGLKSWHDHPFYSIDEFQDLARFLDAFFDLESDQTAAILAFAAWGPIDVNPTRIVEFFLYLPSPAPRGLVQALAGYFAGAVTRSRSIEV